MGIHTLHVEHVVLLSIYTVLTLVNSWFYKETRGVHWFSLYSFLAFLGALAVALRGHIPDFLSIVVGNLLVVAGYVVLLRSLEELLERRVPRRYLQAILFAAATATMLEYGWLQPNTRLRLIAYSVILGLQQIQIAVFILRRQRSALRNVGLPMAVILAALALTNLVRITELIAHGAPQDYLAAGPIPLLDRRRQHLPAVRRHGRVCLAHRRSAAPRARAAGLHRSAHRSAQPPRHGARLRAVDRHLPQAW